MKHAFTLLGLTLFCLEFCIGCGSPIYCPGEPGVDWTEGVVVVRFADFIDSESKAIQIIEEQGLSTPSFIRSPELAWVTVPVGEECQTIVDLEKLEEIKYASLDWLLHIL